MDRVTEVAMSHLFREARDNAGGVRQPRLRPSNTVAINSQLLKDEDQFLSRVVEGAFKVLEQAGVTSR